jgi:SPP1 gp7 family putative phage head morphogenesis protein
MATGGKYIAPGRLVGAASKSAHAQVRALLARIAEEIKELPLDTLRKIAPVLRAAQAELELDLARFLRGVDGGERFTAHLYRTMLRQTRHSLEVIRSIQPTLVEALVEGSAGAAALSNRVLSQEIARLSAIFGGDTSGPGAEPILPRLDIPTVSKLVDRNSWLLTRYQRAAKSWTIAQQHAIRAQMSIGVAKGESVFELSVRIARLGRTGVAAVELDAGGMAAGLFRQGYWQAERLVRTELMNAYNVYHADVIKENGLKKRWDASSDRHCVLCHEVDGEVVEPDEAFSSGDHNPPLHPNCRCIVTPWDDEWPEVKPLPPLDTPDAKRRASGPPGGAVVTRGGTAAETNRALEGRKIRPR